MRLLCLSLMLAVAAAAPIITSQNNKQFRTLRPETPDLRLTPCDYCQKVVLTLEAFASDPETQATIDQYIRDAVCTSLPPQFAQMCTQEVPLLVAQAAQLMRQALDPRDTCAMLGACPGASAAQALGLEAPEASPWDCPMCKMVVVAFMQRMQDRQYRQRLEADMRAACDQLPQDGKARCLDDVAALFAALERLAHDVDPEGLCRVAEFCGGDASLAASEAGAAGAAAAGRLVGAFRQLATGVPVGSANGDMCQNCKTIVLEAAAILQDPKTQNELLEYAKEGCSIFADFKDQCEQYVVLYGPLVFNMLISYLQPEALCTRIGYCPPTMLVS